MLGKQQPAIGSRLPAVPPSPTPLFHSPSIASQPAPLAILSMRTERSCGSRDNAEGGGGEKVLGATQDTLKAFRVNEQIKFDMRCPATLSLSLSLFPTLPFLLSLFSLLQSPVWTSWRAVTHNPIKLMRLIESVKHFCRWQRQGGGEGEGGGKREGEDVGRRVRDLLNCGELFISIAMRDSLRE